MVSKIDCLPYFFNPKIFYKSSNKIQKYLGNCRESNNMKKILIVDDAAFVRKKIRLLVEQNDFEVVGEAENGIEALNMYKLYKPDIVTMDITMPLMDGIEALKSILNFDPKAKVVVVSALGQEAQVKRAVLSGAKSFIVKPLNDEYVINALRKVAAM